MKKIIYIILSLSFLNCSVKNKSEDDQGAYRVNDSTISKRLVLMDRTQCSLKGKNRKTEIEEIVGVWNDTLIWTSTNSDSCWWSFQNIK